MLEIKTGSIDLIYFDPPFFTQKTHSLTTKDGKTEFSFEDKWETLDDYLKLIEDCLQECKRVLKETGSVFIHCDKIASHHIRVRMDKVFGANNFRSEIIWSYKRWSNSKKGLLNSHQNIFFYSKSDSYKFNTLLTNYSNTTNIDQILQNRQRSSNGKTVYQRDSSGNIITSKEKKGVPLNDVWEIPFLNPKAKERVGYPTQKPVLLLQQIIKISTQEGDLVLDPFCGSGTTCVAAKSLNRNYIGIDKSKDAVNLSQNRLNNMIITNSHVVQQGSSSYQNKTEYQLNILKQINATPVQRNKGIDGFLKSHYNGNPVPIKIQDTKETLEEAFNKLIKATINKKMDLKIVIQTKHDNDSLFPYDSNIKIIKSYELKIKDLLSQDYITKQ